MTIDARLEQVRRQLLDLTRRNRLLNFKPGGKRSAAVRSPDAATLYRWLAVDQRTVELAASRSDDATAVASHVPEADSQPSSPDSSGQRTPTVPGDEPAPGITSAEPAPVASHDQSAPAATAEHLAPAVPKGRSAPWVPRVQPLPAVFQPQPAPAEGHLPEVQAVANGGVPTDTVLDGPPDLGRDEPPAAGTPRPRYRAVLDLDETQLHDRLFHLAREAESAQQEQGCDILYVALGLVEWKSGDDKPSSRAPLVLVPVELVRRSARDPYRLRPRDDDPQVNPVLAELCRREFGIALPELELAADDPFAALWRAVEEQVARLPGWRLHGEAHLGLFSFAKLLMYLDLDPERWPEDALRRHELVRALAGMSATSIAAPRATEPAELDQRRPHEFYLVLDADSSQQIALMAAKEGQGMVIDGPPGTGKSQTITNLIAEFLAEGKRVLFVAEKAAALEVVKRRLDAVGLGDFVLELHSRKVSKRRVLDELDRALRTDFHPPQAAEAKANELERVRNELSNLVRDLHEPLGALGISPREAIEKCVQYSQAAEAAFDVEHVLDWTSERLHACQQALTGLASALEQAGGFENPWRGTWVTELALLERQQLPASLRQTVAALENMLAAAGAAAANLNIPAPATLADCRRLQDAVCGLTGEIQLRPGVPVSPAWDAAPREALRLIELCRRQAELRKELEGWFHPRAERAALDWDALAMRRVRQAESPWRWLNPRWYADGLRLASLLKGHSPWDARVPHQLVQMARLQTCRREIERLDADGAALFGPHWQGTESDARELEEYVRYAVVIRRLVREGYLPADSAARALTPAGRAGLVPLAGSFLAALAAWESSWSMLCTSLQLAADEFLGGAAEAIPLERWRQRLLACAEATALLDDWLLVVRRWHECTAARLQPILDWCRGDGRAVPFPQWSEVFLRQFYRLWFEAACRQRPLLAARTAADLDALAERFRQLDREWLQTSRARLVAEIDARRPGPARTASRSSRLALLQAEIRRRRGIKPLRQLLRLCGDAVQSLKPCFLMSPISVAQFLEPGRLHFDAAIFDEASQIEPADALGAVARATKLILVGDERQLPPTRFFSAYDSAELDSNGQDDADQEPSPAAVTDLESVLGIGHVCLPTAMLRWHYRSRHESLIEFSNRTFYDGQLRVFPSPCEAQEDLGLSLRHLPQATYARGAGRYNPDEARAVAEEVFWHARHRPHLSLGVGAFSLAQQRAIQDEIERRRLAETDPACEAFFATHPEEPFFVKNLETIQGDERDVILLSVGYGRDAQGKVSLNFGPLNQQGGWRRLNVLVTRARRQCVVFSSLRAEDLKVGPASPRGVRALRDFLEYAALPPAARAAPNATPGVIEQQICRALGARGWEVVALPQPGPLDLAVRDPRHPGRYLLGIRCDGRAWAALPTVRDRERLVEEVLHGLGWRVARVWSTAWLRQPEQVVARLERLLADALAGDPHEGSVPAADTQGTAALGGGGDAHAGPDAYRGAEGPALPRGRTEGCELRQSQGGGRVARGKPVAAENAAGLEAQTASSIGGRSEAQPSPAPQGTADAGTQMLPGVQPYRAYRGRRRGARESLLRLSPSKLDALLKQIVQVEWPIHREELARQVCSLYGTTARGEAKALIDDAIDRAAGRGGLVLRGEFAWLPGQTQPPVRWRGDEQAVTDPRLIDPHEVAAAAVLAARFECGIPADELPAAALRAMGFKRAGPQLAELARSGVELALSVGLLRADAAGFLVPAAETS